VDVSQSLPGQTTVAAGDITDLRTALDFLHMGDRFEQSPFIDVDLSRYLPPDG
jgi:hypothetical protein